jgi:hypothetical protein
MKLFYISTPFAPLPYMSFTLDSVSYTQQTGANSSTQLVQISSKQSDKYRFGYNGQEKDNEIAGVGNHNTAEFWEYSTQTGIRWNRDPKPQISVSDYAVNSLNPIKISDPLGDFDTKRAANWYKFWHGGKVHQNSTSGEYYLVKRVKYEGEGAGVAEKIRYDWSGRNQMYSLYRTPDGEMTHTPGEWAEHYKGMNWYQIARERGMESYVKGLIQVSKGPKTDWRYVKLSDNKILDMRHVLIVGMKMGVVGGAGLEYAQYSSSRTRPSANQEQDFYSNKVGSGLLDYLQQKSPYYDPAHSTQDAGNWMETDFSRYFYDYIKSRKQSE